MWLTTLKKKLVQILTRAVLKLAPDALNVQVIQTTPPEAVRHFIHTDKTLGKAWDKTPVPTDPIELIMYRAGVKSYREQLLKALDASQKSLSR